MPSTPLSDSKVSQVCPQPGLALQRWILLKSLGSIFAFYEMEPPLDDGVQAVRHVQAKRKPP